MVHLGRASAGHDQRGNMTRKTSGNDHLGTLKPLRHVILRETYKVGAGGGGGG